MVCGCVRADGGSGGGSDGGEGGGSGRSSGKSVVMVIFCSGVVV